MAKALASKGANILVWILLVLLIIGLAGFGIGNFGGSVRAIGSVGDEEIPVEDYARALDNELRDFQARTGEAMSLSEARAFGLDQIVLDRLVRSAALDNEAAQLGLSVGDAEVRRRILQVSAFQGIDGSFDRTAYEFALEQANISPAAFDEELREEATRNLMRDAVTGGVQPGETYAETVLAFLGENRSFQWAPITPEMLVGPAPEPDEAALEAYYDANPETFTAPETRRITFAWLTPDMLLGEIEVDEAALRALYDERRGDYDVPERRLVERLVFENAEAADEARAAIDAGNADFAAAVEARGLALEDVDLGEVARDALAPAAAEAVFALDAPGVVGPVESALGPALYRVNAILEARLTPYEEAREDLLAEFAGDRARRVVDDSIGPVDDLLASGATLEEVAAETAMELGRIDFTTASEDGIAGYDAFREEALLAQPGDFPEVRDLSDGGIFALRVDEVVAPALRPFDEVRDEVAAAWSADETQRRLRALGESLEAQLAAGTGFEALGLEPVAETGLRRDAFIDDAPPGLVGAVFALDPGAVALVEGDGMVALARLDSIAPYDRNDAEMAALRGALAGAQADGIASDLYTLFTVAVRDAAGISLDPAAINAVHAQFP